MQEVTSHLPDWLLSPTWEIASVAEKVQKQNSWARLVGTYICATTVENVREAPQEIKKGTTIWSALLLPGTYLKRTLTEKDAAFIAAFSTTAKTWTRPKCSLKDDWLKKLLYLPIGLFLSVYTPPPYRHTGISSRHNKEWNLAVWNSIDGRWRSYAKQDKADRKIAA